VQGRRKVDEDGNESFNDLCSENVMLANENEQLRVRIKALQGTLETYRLRAAQTFTANASLALETAGMHLMCRLNESPPSLICRHRRGKAGRRASQVY